MTVNRRPILVNCDDEANQKPVCLYGRVLGKNTLTHLTIKQKMQKQQEQVNSLQTQLDKVDEELEQLTSVYSPYRGKVRRVKILGQNERAITAEVTLDIRGGQ
ncbi:hypothetical protein C7B62_15080 [Pleurocapsa sp. CCALA 161]|uniref:hypothetical protein n=1 Tax=Pleurocapsa sp. CCALA 161 TaxID=2107688 RepID=UPI000D07F034|nr:hypothetical protein [Pleurocapsa sp. CCALA 161]PSB08895.1 hypothetical protein C7B62_15080 [Pleurocapsa sp. CCALA 161]